MTLESILAKKLALKKENDALRSLGTQTRLVDFSSNDYLGLARSEELFNKIQQKVSSLPHANGATGSRLLTGNNAYIEEVENKLSKIFKSEAALIFNSGYTANLSILSSIPQRGDTIIYDELAHACIKDGARLSMATRHPFKHNDLSDLELKLKKATGNIYIAVESIYSMDGDECPLEDLCALAENYSASIILDEAHSTGVVGKNGGGLAVHKDIHAGIPIRIYTFGKAMGIHGACVCGDKNIIEYLINFARPFIYTTALPIHSVASIDCAFSYLSENIKTQEALRGNIENYIQQINRVTGLTRTKSSSAIQTIISPGNKAIKDKALSLKEMGFDIRPILSPTVKEGSERLRICIHSFNTNQEIDNLVNSIKIISEK